MQQVLLLSPPPQQVKAQEYTYVDREGKDIRKYRPTPENISGTPFLVDKWLDGTVVNSKGVTFNNVRLKFDVYNDKLLYAETNNEALEFPENIKKFTLNNMVFINGLPSVDTLSELSYYQLLADGKTKLLRHPAKHIVESKGYGSSMTNYRFDDMQVLYIYKDVKMIAIKQDKKSVLAVLADKETEMNNYLANHKVNFKNNADLTALIAYYNTL